MEQNVRQVFPLDCLQEIEDIEETDIADLIGKTWNIFSVTTIFNFQLNNHSRIKLFSKRIREILAQKLPKEDQSYKATLTVLNEFPLPNQGVNPKPLKIEVTSTKLDKSTTIYSGIMLSWGLSETVNVAEDSINLPILLCRGTQNTMKVMNQILSYLFDCTIVALPINADDYKWILGITLKAYDTDSYGEIKLYYRFPELTDTDDIVVRFEINQVVTLMERLSNSREPVLTLRETKLLMNYLQHHMYINIGINAERSVPYKFDAPAMAIQGTKFKVLNAELLNAFLIYFHEKIVNMLYRRQSFVQFEEPMS